MTRHSENEDGEPSVKRDGRHDHPQSGRNRRPCRFTVSGGSLATSTTCSQPGRAVGARLHRSLPADGWGEVAEAALARATPGRQLRESASTATARVDCHLRASSAKRLAIDQLRPGSARAGQRACGSAETNRFDCRPPGRRRQAGAIAPNAAGSAQVVLAEAEAVVTPGQKVRRDPFEGRSKQDAFIWRSRKGVPVPGSARTRSVVVDSRIFRVERRVRITPRWCALTVRHNRLRSGASDFQTGVVDRRAAPRLRDVEDYPELQETRRPPRGGEKLKASRAYQALDMWSTVAAVPGDPRSSALHRARPRARWEENLANSFVKPGDAGKGASARCRNR